MEAGNVNQFLEEITWQEETILFNGKKYFFNPWEHQGIGRLEIQQWNLKDEWVSDFFYVEGNTTEECVKKMVAAPIWDGKTFWEAESEMTWTD